LEKLERYDEALLELENSLKKYPDDVILLNAEAGIYRSMGNYKETIRIVTKALKISPNETFLKRNLGRAYLENKDYEKAIKLLSDLNEKQNDDLAVCYLSDAYVATNNFAKAISILKKAHKKSPQNTMIIANLMDLYYLSKDYEQAEIYGKKFEKLLPNNPKIYSVMGFIYRYLKNYEQSLAYFNKYLMLIPNDVDTLYNIACLKSINHEFIEALAILKLVVVSDKKYKKMAKDDPDFDLLKNNLEFKKIMK
jgi:tetratricopeptide (TPR) repeat protein